MISPKYCDYIAYEIAQTLKECINEPQLKHHFWNTPTEPLIKEVGSVEYSESPAMDLSKTISIIDINDSTYEVIVKEVEKSDEKKSS